MVKALKTGFLAGCGWRQGANNQTLRCTMSIRGICLSSALHYYSFQVELLCFIPFFLPLVYSLHYVPGALM